MFDRRNDNTKIISKLTEVNTERDMLDQIERDKDNSRIVALEEEVALLRHANQLRIEQIQQLQHEVNNQRRELMELWRDLEYLKLREDQRERTMPNDDDYAHGRGPRKILGSPLWGDDNKLMGGP
jgi:uncharacterized protein (DUF342 family)